MKEHEFLAMMEVQRASAQFLQSIAEGISVVAHNLGSLVEQGEFAMVKHIEIRGDDGRVITRLLPEVGDPGPAATGWVQVMASDGNPISPTEGSSFKLDEEGLLLVCMTQEQFNALESTIKKEKWRG